MSILTYNGRIFGPNGWQTLSFNQEAVPDDSNTETELVRITITGEFLLSLPYDGSSPPDRNIVLRSIKNDFMTRRKTLSFTVDGEEMIPSTTPDARNGPVPTYLNIVQLTAATFVCQLQVVSHWAETAANQEGGKVLSHRWNQNVEIDENEYSLHTRTGKISVASSFFNSQKNLLALHKLRDSLATTSVDPGFLRESVTYTVAENGLALNYTIRDREQFRMPPFPATTWDGGFTATTQRMGSAARNCQANCTLRGPKKPSAAPARLLAEAVKIAYVKCKNNSGFFPTSGNFHESSYKNEVRCTVAGMNFPPGHRTGATVAATNAFLTIGKTMKGFGDDPEDTGKGKAVAPRDMGGTANVLLKAAEYHNPTDSQELDKLTGSVKPDTLRPGG